MIVYNIDTGDIVAEIPDDQDYLGFFHHYPEEFKENLASLSVANPPRDLENYKIVKEQLLKRTQEEIEEIKLYRRVLTEEERQLQKLKPSQEEIRKAEQTIEILTLIQEVI